MKPRILIVEDEPEMREALKHVLRADYEVVVCSNGQEALGQLDKTDKPVDLVITDIRMPGMSGYEMILKMQEKPPSPPIIVMSVYFDDDPELTVEIKRRVDRLVRKPMDLKEMKQMVEGILRMRGSENSNTAGTEGSEVTEVDDGKEKIIEQRSQQTILMEMKQLLEELLRMGESEHSNTAGTEGSEATEVDDGKKKIIEQRSQNTIMNDDIKYLLEELIWKVVTYGHGCIHGEKQAGYNYCVV